MIQRFAHGIHPQIMGSIPFFVQGPTISSWCDVDRNGGFSLGKRFSDVITLLDDGDIAGRCYAMADMVLSQGIISAAWSSLSTMALPDKVRISRESLSEEFGSRRKNFAGLHEYACDIIESIPSIKLKNSFFEDEEFSFGIIDRCAFSDI